MAMVDFADNKSSYHSNSGGMVSGGSMLGPGGGDLSLMFQTPPHWYKNKTAYPVNNYNSNEYSKSGAGALGALAGGAIGYSNPALLAGALSKVAAGGAYAKLAGAGLALMSTPAAPFIAGAAFIAAGGIAGAILGVHGKDIAKVGAGALKATFNIAKFVTLGTAKAIGYTAKALAGFNRLSSKYTQLSHQFPDKLQKNLEQQKQAEQKFSQMVKEARKELKQGKDIKEKLSDLQQYRIPSQKAQKEYSDLLADYNILKSAKANNGKLDLKQIKKEYKEFAKANNWSRGKLRSELSALNRRLEEHKDNLNLKENNEIDKSFLNQYSNSKDKVADMQNNFNSKGDAEKKSLSPTQKGHNQDFNRQLSKEVKKDQQKFDQKNKEAIQQKKAERQQQSQAKPQPQQQQHRQNNDIDRGR